MNVSRTSVTLVLFALGGCASLPTGPSVLALPGTGRSFDQFRVDDANCRNYAYVQLGGAAGQQAPTSSAATSAAVGTALGAAAGAGLGGGQGAAAGAGVGLLGGGLLGADSAPATGYDQQERYDNAYVQCMYAQGNRVPVWGSFTQTAPTSSSVPPQPPPPGTPPDPPPDLTTQPKVP